MNAAKPESKEEKGWHGMAVASASFRHNFAFLCTFAVGVEFPIPLRSLI